MRYYDASGIEGLLAPVEWIEQVVTGLRVFGLTLQVELHRQAHAASETPLGCNFRAASQLDWRRLAADFARLAHNS